MKKNEERVGTVSAIGSNGEGVIKQDGAVVFVPYALVGEKIKYKVLKATAKCVFGKVMEIFSPAEIRERAMCPVFEKCGGCQLQHIRYVNQLKIKEENVATCFKKIAGLDVKVKSAVKGDNNVRYRNKLQLAVAQSNDGTKIGFYAENSHRIIPIDDCVINAEWTKDVISAFKQYIEEFNIEGYNELENSGELREITVKDVKGNLIITAVSVKPNLRGVERLLEILKDAVRYNFSLYVNINTNGTNVIYGDTFKLVYGEGSYTGDMLGIKYNIGVQSFMQVNNSVCAKLYSAVRSAVNADEQTTVIDAYSGAGLMTALLAKSAQKAIGIEIVPEAVQCANQLAKVNKLEHKITNYLGKCEDILPQVIENEKSQGNKVCLVLDPPRKGCDLKVLNAIIDNDIDKIVYVSCKPSTLARDIGLLIGSLEQIDGEIKKVENYTPRYNVELVRPFDMFSHTKHIETLVCLTRKA